MDQINIDIIANSKYKKIVGDYFFTDIALYIEQDSLPYDSQWLENKIYEIAVKSIDLPESAETKLRKLIHKMIEGRVSISTVKSNNKSYSISIETNIKSNPDINIHYYARRIVFTFFMIIGVSIGGPILATIWSSFDSYLSVYDEENDKEDIPDKSDLNDLIEFIDLFRRDDEFMEVTLRYLIGIER